MKEPFSKKSSGKTNIMKMKNKKGDIAVKQIITILILIVSFAIIIAFFFMLNLRETIDKESCRNSVVLRGNVPFGEQIKLQCKTQDICFSKGDKCKEELKGTINIRVSDKNELLDELTDLIYDCHWQMGSGEIDYLPSNWGLEKNYCTICNTIYFSDDFKEDGELSVIDVKEIFIALQNKPAPGQEGSMLFSMYGLSSIDSLYNNEEVAKVFDSGKYDFSYEKGYVLMSVLSNEGLFKIGNIIAYSAGAVVGIGFLFVAPPAGAALIGGAVAGVGVVIAGPEDTKYLPPMLHMNDASEIEDKKCDGFTTSD